MEYIERLNRLRSLMKEHQIDMYIVDDLTNILYLTGLELSAGRILVTLTKAFLIVDDRYYERCNKYSPLETRLQSQFPLETLLQQNTSPPCSVGFDTETTPYQSFEEYNKITQKISPQILLKPVPNLVKKLRSIKDTQEISLLQQAADLGCEGFHYLCGLLKEGVTETQLAVELEIFWRRRGGKKLAFDPIIAFGANSSMPHHRASATPLKQGDIVLIDIGVNLNHYHSDMTRTVFFGKPVPQLEEIYAIVEEAQSKALHLCKPGVKIGAVDLAARDFIAAKGYGERFSHGLGHGVGLEIHELPVVRSSAAYRDTLLEPGMVITIEPGIYLPNIGGVRIEDTIVITSDGYDNMTRKTC